MEIPAAELQPGTHFWASGKFHLAHSVSVSPVDRTVIITTGRGTLFLAADTPVHLHERD